MSKKKEDNLSIYPNSIDTRVALLEMSISNINETMKRVENRLEKLDSKIDSRFIWMLTFIIGGFVSVLGVISHVAKWI